MSAKRRFKKLSVKFISLVDKGANNKAIVWKSATPTEDPTFQKTITLAKIDDEARMVFGLVYAPEEVDSQGDVASADVIKEAAYDFMREGRAVNVDKQHDYRPTGNFVAESWIVKAGDPDFAEVGAWAVGIKIEDDATWEEVKKGEISGLSLAGAAEAEDLTKSDATLTIELDEVAEPERPTLIKRIKKWLGIAKDFNQMVEGGHIYFMLDAFHSAVREIFEPGYAGDRKAALLESIDQMRQYVLTNIEKEEPKPKESDMNEELAKAITDAVAAAVAPLAEKVEALEKAVTPDESPAVEETPAPEEPTQEAVMADVLERLGKLEKASNGSTRIKGQDPTPEDLEKQREVENRIFLPPLTSMG